MDFVDDRGFGAGPAGEGIGAAGGCDAFGDDHAHGTEDFRQAFAAAEPDYGVITDDEAQDVLMLISHFPQVVRKAMEQSEPSLITRHTTQLAQAYNKYYFEHRIMDESDPAGTAARVNLTRAVRDVIKTGLYLIGVEAPERM